MKYIILTAGLFSLLSPLFFIHDTALAATPEAPRRTSTRAERRSATRSMPSHRTRRHKSSARRKRWKQYHRRSRIRRVVHGRGLLGPMTSGQRASSAVAQVFRPHGKKTNRAPAAQRATTRARKKNLVARRLHAASAVKIQPLTTQSSHGVREAPLKREARVALVAQERPTTRPRVERIPPDIVAKRVQSNRQALNRCYLQELKRNPNVAGEIELTITINKQGTVKRATVRGPARYSSTLRKCTERQVRTWRFPAPQRAPATTTFPVVFARST